MYIIIVNGALCTKDLCFYFSLFTDEEMKGHLFIKAAKSKSA